MASNTMALSEQEQEGDISNINGRIVIQESQGVEEQLLDDQIRLTENATYEVPIEQNVYGALLILMMIDKEKSFQHIYEKKQAQYEKRILTDDDGEEDEWFQWCDKVDNPEDTAWRDIAGLLGAGATVIASMWIQFMFGFYMMPLIAKDSYSENLGDSTAVPPTLSIYKKMGTDECAGDIFNYHADKLGDMGDYSSKAHLFGIDMARGLMFGILSIIVWASVVVENARKAVDFFILACLPNRRDTTVFTWDSLGLQIVIGLIAIFRCGVQLLIAFHGVRFLAWTDNLGDFILNSLALEFLYQIPDKMYNAFASTRTKSWVSAAAGSAAATQMFSRDLPNWTKIFNGAICVFVGGGITFAYGFSLLLPFATMLKYKVYKTMC